MMMETGASIFAQICCPGTSYPCPRFYFSYEAAQAKTQRAHFYEDTD